MYLQYPPRARQRPGSLLYPKRKRRIYLMIGLGLLLLFLLNELRKIRNRITPPRDACEVMEEATPIIPGGSKIPKIVHQMWPKHEPMPPHVKTWVEKWKTLFPGVEHRLWDDAEIESFMRTEFPWFMPTFNSYPYNIMKVDAARTFLLYKYGGVYADADYEPLANFWDRLPDDGPSFVESFWAHEAFQNSLMVSPPRHPFWNVTWELMTQRARAKSEKTVVDTLTLTGPQMLIAAVDKYKRMHVGKPIHTLPCQNWQRLSTGYEVGPSEHWARTFQYYFKETLRKCGSVSDPRCQLAVHHSRTMWNPV